MKNNKLIAEFMGIKSYKFRGYTMFVYEENNHRADTDLQYHTSWDWLMPVVSKIARNEEYFENVLSERLFDIVPFGRIEEVYEVVVEFIKTYNNEQ
tara:strand:+ start:383 stop:670 length:288 start_codon:yes stop_codon:yes gene_type:complete